MKLASSVIMGSVLSRTIFCLGLAIVALGVSAEVSALERREGASILKKQPAKESHGKPLWQLGVGFGALSTPYYLGADASQTTVLPTLVPIYRGRFVKMDEQGLRGDLLNSDHWDLDMSFDGSLGVPSDEVEARNGMPDLAPLAMAGPSTIYRFNTEGNGAWSIELALRVGVSVDLDEQEVDYQGLVFNPKVIYEKSFYSRFPNTSKTQSRGFSPSGVWRLKSSIGPMWASQRYNEYYYQVSPEFSTETRTSYMARAGYNGWRFQSSLSYFGEKWLLGLFTRYENTNKSVNEASPLMQNSNNLTVGAAATYFLWSSERRATK